MVSNRDVRCAAREMHTLFRLRTTAACKSCDLYFICMANGNAMRSCGEKKKAALAATAISECDVTDSSVDDESFAEAATFGRDGGDCASLYLCATGCKFSVSDESCSANCSTA